MARTISDVDEVFLLTIALEDDPLGIQINIPGFKDNISILAIANKYFIDIRNEKNLTPEAILFWNTLQNENDTAVSRSPRRISVDNSDKFENIIA